MWMNAPVLVKLQFFSLRNPFVSVPSYEILECHFSYKPALFCQATEPQETKAPEIL